MIKYNDGTKDVFANEQQPAAPQPIAPQAQPVAVETQPATAPAPVGPMADSTVQQAAPGPEQAETPISPNGSWVAKKGAYGQARFARKIHGTIVEQTPFQAGKAIPVIGTGFSFMNSYTRGNLDEFWHWLSDDPDRLPDAGATGLITFGFGMKIPLDPFGKDWLGFEVQGVKTADHAIWGSKVAFAEGADIHFDGFFLNLIAPYSHALDPKNTFFLSVEPGLDMALMSGRISAPPGKLSTSTEWVTVDEAMLMGVGWHAAAESDVMFKRFLGMNVRFGYRGLSTPESHLDIGSTTGYKNYYVSPTIKESLKIDWSGMYFTMAVYIMISPRHRSVL